MHLPDMGYIVLLVMNTQEYDNQKKFSLRFIRIIVGITNRYFVKYKKTGNAETLPESL